MHENPGPDRSTVHRILIPLLRTLSDGQFHTGSALAEQFDVSRATVCNALKSAEALSVRVFRVQGRGYRLAEPFDWLDAKTICTGLQGPAQQIRIKVADITESTNTTLLRAAEPLADQECLLAEYQSAGRGRRGRSWQAPLGGSILCSVRWRFQLGIGALTGLSLATGVAILRSLRALGAHDLQLKWPNDLLWRERKLAGILIEVQGEANGPSIAVIGIGINIRLPDNARDGIDQPVADLTEITGAPVSRNRAATALLNELGAILTDFETGGFDSLRDEWNAAHAHAGKQLEITLADGSRIHGQALGLSPQGALLLQNDAGHQIAIHSGDIRLARRA